MTNLLYIALLTLVLSGDKGSDLDCRYMLGKLYCKNGDLVFVRADK